MFPDWIRVREIHREIDQITGLFSGDQPPDPEQMARYGSLNAGFHHAIVDLAKSPLLSWFIHRLYAVAFASPTAVVMPPDGSGAATASSQHAAILEAIASRDGTRAEAIVREHALLAFRSLEKAIDRKPQVDPHHVGLAMIRGPAPRPKTRRLGCRSRSRAGPVLRIFPMVPPRGSWTPPHLCLARGATTPPPLGN